MSPFVLTLTKRWAFADAFIKLRLLCLPECFVCISMRERIFEHPLLEMFGAVFRKLHVYAFVSLIDRYCPVFQ